jgi:hypothetical protein
LFFFIVAFVNPVREMMVDDDWAYGSLLATGRIQAARLGGCQHAGADLMGGIFGTFVRLFLFHPSLLDIRRRRCESEKKSVQHRPFYLIPRLWHRAICPTLLSPLLRATAGASMPLRIRPQKPTML